MTKAKKLDCYIASKYAELANGKAIMIMNIGKVYAMGRSAYTGEGTAEVDAAIAAGVALYCA